MKFVRLVSVLAVAVAGVSGGRAAAPAPAGFTFIRSAAGIDEYRLDANGLQVLLKTDPSAPVVTYNTTYHVGSRNEATGTTGATHLLEHLMFKGSEHYNDPAGNSIKQYLERVGARFNATTSYDRTNYFATLAPRALAGYIAIEADRMRHLWLHESDRQTEMTVVRNEFERGENNPVQALQKEVFAAAYQALPYHHPVIGWRSDIEHVPIQRLRAFYDTYYWPNNATVVIVGDVDRDRALGLVRAAYGAIPRSPQPIPPMYTEEPPQTGPRHVVVKRPGQLGAVMIAYKVPPARDPDSAPLEVLDYILGQGRTSRLYRALVETGLALDVGAYDTDSHDPGLNVVTAMLAPGAAPEAVEKAILATVDTVQREGITADELATAERKFRVQLVEGRDGSAAVASELNEWIAAGDWTLYATFRERVKAVTAADVQRVARQYLDVDQSTTGWFVPQAGGRPAQPGGTPAAHAP